MIEITNVTQDFEIICNHPEFFEHFIKMYRLSDLNDIVVVTYNDELVIAGGIKDIALQVMKILEEKVTLQ